MGILSSTDLYDHYSARFNVIACVDLADLTHNHKAVFEFFNRHFQDRFLPDDRIILYTQHRPSQKILDHVQRAVVKIDISNWFVLIVCPHDITHELKISNGKYGHDQVTIGHEQYDPGESSPLLDHAIACFDTICPAPFMQLDVSISDNVKPCCKFVGSIGRIGHGSLDQMFHNGKMDRVRQSMMQGLQPPDCHVCFENESKATTSLRQHLLAEYHDQMDQHRIDDPRVTSMTVMPSIICNFHCRICDERASSKIAAKVAEQTEDTQQKRHLQTWIKKVTSRSNATKLLDQVKAMRSLEDVHFLGGEPFLWPDLPHLIDHYIAERLSSNMRLKLSSNGSLFPEQILAKIQRNYAAAEIMLSIDNVGEKFEVERGGQWSQIYQNLQKFANVRSDKISVKLAVTVNIQNLLDLEDLVRLNQSIGLDGIVWWYLEYPESLCIDRVSAKTKQLVVQKYRDHDCPELRAIAKRMEHTKPCDPENFLRYTQLLDQRNQQQFALTHRDIYQAMAGCDSD